MTGIEHIRLRAVRLSSKVQCMILDAWGWCTGTTQRDGVGMGEGGERRVQDGEHMYTCSGIVLQN